MKVLEMQSRSIVRMSDREMRRTRQQYGERRIRSELRAA
jgi:hypothetical protein